MSQMIDLMPGVCRRRMKQRSHAKRWCFAYVVVALLVIGAGATARMFEHAQLREAKALRAQVDFNTEQERQARRLEQAIAVYEGRIDRHESLAWPVRLSDVVSVIGQVTPDSVSLTSFGVSPRRARGSRGRRAVVGSGGEEEGMRIVVELKGIAPDDLQMATLVSRLEQHPLFQRIAVDYARKAQIRGVEGREFGVTCEIDAGARYAFVDIAGEEGDAP